MAADNACQEHRFLKQFLARTEVGRASCEAVRKRCKELGLDGKPPWLGALEGLECYSRTLRSAETN